MDFDRLPIERNPDGNLRKADFELEFSGIALKRAVGIVTDLFGGQPIRENAFRWVVEDTAYGRFGMELDFPMLKDERYKSHLAALGIELDASQWQSLERFLDNAASTVIPYEIVTPPMPVSDLGAVERLREALRQAGAEGTRASFADAAVDAAQSDMHLRETVDFLKARDARRILDAATGLGRYSTRLLYAGFDVVSVDRDLSLKNEASRFGARYGHRLHIADKA